MAPMLKSILVPIAGIEDDKGQMLGALAVARRFTAHLDVVHVRPDPAQLVAAAASTAYGSADFVAALVDQLEKDAQTRLNAAQAAFAAFVDEEHLELRGAADGVDVVTAAWLEQTGNVAECVAQLGRVRDLLVLGRASGSPGIATGTLEAALMQSGRPVLIMPPGVSHVLGRTVIVAWKDSAEAARAASAAMPFLAMAERVLVIEISEEETAANRQAGDSSKRLVDGLAWHRIKAENLIVRAGDRSGPEALLAAARDVGAHLIVMGAYGHSRFREMIFGGFTRRILRAADFPVLMFH
jgi:nucleotide-binding universal stress UspA family protein